MVGLPQQTAAIFRRGSRIAAGILSLPYAVTRAPYGALKAIEIGLSAAFLIGFLG